MNKQKKTIVVVDDVPDNIYILTSILQDDYIIKPAKSGQQALKIINMDQKPDMILLDIMMPEMDGYAVIQQLKADEATKDIPVIFVSALGEVKDETYGFSLGAADYIIKPVNPAIVKARVQTHLTLYEQHLSLEAQRLSLEEKNTELEKVVRVLENKLARSSTPQSVQEALSDDSDRKTPAPIEPESNEYSLDDHQQDLDNLIQDIDSAVNLIILRNRFDPTDFTKAGTLLRKYADILIQYPLFRRLGNGLNEFSDLLCTQDLEPEQQNLEFALGCLESLIYTLDSWHRQIFSHKLNDPNIFDNSMLSDMETVTKALKNNYGDSDDMDFF